MSNSWDKIPNVNKDFNLSREQEAAQKTAREQQETERQAQIQQIRDKDEREKIEKAMAERDKDIARSKQMEKEHQETREMRETQRRVDAQRNPQLAHQILKSATGKAPDQVAREVREENKNHREQQIRQAEVKVGDFHNKAIDRKIDRALERQQQRDDVQNRPPDQVFEKPAEEKSVKDAFAHAHDRNDKKSWQQLRAERGRGENEL